MWGMCCRGLAFSRKEDSTCQLLLPEALSTQAPQAAGPSARPETGVEPLCAQGHALALLSPGLVWAGLLLAT